MRRFLIFLLLMSASLASADRLINVPMGRKLPFKTLRFELAADLTRGETFRTFTGLGVGRSFDMEIRTEHGPLLDPAVAVDFSYNYLDPFVDFNPGVSIGMLDVFDRGADGRRYFFAMTFLLGDGLDVPMETTIGAVFGRKSNGAIVGVRIPFGDQLKLLAEHDGARLNAGVEMRLVRGVDLRAYVRGRETLVGLTSRVRL